MSIDKRLEKIAKRMEAGDKGLTSGKGEYVRKSTDMVDIQKAYKSYTGEDITFESNSYPDVNKLVKNLTVRELESVIRGAVEDVVIEHSNPKPKRKSIWRGF